jgi:GT2 family glycosyltransferase
MKVSVIVPTFRDWDQLSLCVSALKNQTYPQKLLDVIIVNNDPNSDSVNLNLPNNYKLINEKKPGSYAARNSGLKISKGDVVAFTDSDCQPDAYWIEKAVSRLNGGADRVAGHVELFFKHEKLTCAEIYEKAFAFNQSKYADNGTAVTANMITWRSYFDTVGLFDEKLMSGGDMQWGWRANEIGVPIVYAPEVIVKHPARENMSALFRKAKRVTIGAVAIQKYTVLSIVKRGFFPPISLVSELRNNNKLNINEKIIAFHIAWLLKVYTSSTIIRRLIGCKSKMNN